jgi:hypothetical protein
MNYMYNNQIYAQFILSLLGYHTCTCFGRINSPSAEFRLSAGLGGMDKYHLPHIYIIPPDDGLLILPIHVEV